GPLKEECMKQGRAWHNREKADSLFWYDGIESNVTRIGARSEIRTFSQNEDFDFRQSESAWAAYSRRRETGPPDRFHLLENTQLYDRPLGFLTGVHELIREISRQFQVAPQTWMRMPYQLSYAYHSKAYSLKVVRLRHESGVSALSQEMSSVSSSILQVSEAVEAEFQVAEKSSGRPHNFTLWFSVKGPDAMVPLKIVDNPRWWLQVELNLVASSKSEHRPFPAGKPPGSNL